MSELANRRDKIFDLMKENSVAIVFAGAAKISSEDEFYPFVVNNCFFYLTEIKQENSVLLLVKGIGERKEYLFVEEYNELKEKWTGKRISYEEASSTSDIQNIYSLNNFENMVNLVFSNENNQYGQISHLYLDLSPENKISEQRSTKTFGDEMINKHNHLEILDIKPFFTALRMVKSNYEVAKLKMAISTTQNGINKLISILRPGLIEYQLADAFEFFGREHGRHELAFSTIIANGKNATCLHYPTQNDPVEADKLILFDLGYKHDGYCADISRTFPVNGKFNEEQARIYNAVLRTNKAIIDFARPGLTLKDLQDKTKELLKEELVKMKLLTSEDDISRYYFHNVSHHLGLDTHDISNREKPLEPGNVITVEPGLYISELGIGVRIEDDILITNGKAECLSIDIPKEISDIEKLMRFKRR